MEIKNPTAKVMSVHPGDLDKRFLLLHVGDGIHNRPIDQKLVTKYARMMDQIEGSLVTLVSMGNGKYKVIDGQHRITAVSERDIGVREFTAVVYPKDAPMDRLIEFAYKGKSQTVSDTLHMHKSASNWPKVFEDGDNPSDVKMVYRGSAMGKGFSWSTTVRAAASHQRSVDHDDLGGCRVLRDLVINAWLNTPADNQILPDNEVGTYGVRHYRGCLEWWLPIVKDLPNYHQRILCGLQALKMVFLFGAAYDLSHSDCAAVANRFRRISTADINGLKMYAASSSFYFFAVQFMRVVNKGKRKDLFEILDINGREEI